MMQTKDIYKRLAPPRESLDELWGILTNKNIQMGVKDWNVLEWLFEIGRKKNRRNKR